MNIGVLPSVSATHYGRPGFSVGTRHQLEKALDTHRSLRSSMLHEANLMKEMKWNMLGPDPTADKQK